MDKSIENKGIAVDPAEAHAHLHCYICFWRTKTILKLFIHIRRIRVIHSSTFCVRNTQSYSDGVYERWLNSVARRWWRLRHDFWWRWTTFTGSIFTLSRAGYMSNSHYTFSGLIKDSMWPFTKDFALWGTGLIVFLSLKNIQETHECTIHIYTHTLLAM